MNKKVKNGALYVTELDYHARYDSAESDYKLYIHTVYCILYRIQHGVDAFCSCYSLDKDECCAQLFAKLCKTGPCLIC